MIFLLLLFSFVTFFCLTEQQDAPVHELCRFTHWFDQDSLMGNSPLMNASYFEQNVFYWEGQFHQDGIGYHQPTGVTMDHVLVGYATGIASVPPHMVSNPKNEVQLPNPSRYLNSLLTEYRRITSCFSLTP